MADRGFATFLKVLFGIGGIIIVIIAWSRIMALPDRIIFTFIGFGGILLALREVIPFRYILTKLGVVRDLTQVQSREE